MHPLSSAVAGAATGAGPPTVAARGAGELAVVESLPDAVVSLFSALTYLGDPWVCLFAVSFAYAVGERAGIARPAAAFVLALGLGAVGLTVGLKQLFALPRPPGAVEPGYGFPSGHALGATVFWGGVALLADAGRRRHRLVAAGIVVAVVAVSRVVVGVHYLSDVAAGVAVAVGFLAVGVAAGPGLRHTGVPSDRAVVGCFLAGGALTACAALLDPIESEVLLGVGTAVGGAVAWSVLGGTAAGESEGDGDGNGGYEGDTLSTRSVAVGTVAVPLPLVAMAVVAELPVGAFAVVAAGGVGGAALLSLPVAASSLVDPRG